MTTHLSVSAGFPGPVAGKMTHRKQRCWACRWLKQPGLGLNFSACDGVWMVRSLRRECARRGKTGWIRLKAPGLVGSYADPAFV